jgi:hypothetical protein
VSNSEEGVGEPADTSAKTPFEPVPTRRALRSVASELLRPKPGPAPTGPLSPRAAKARINGLDKRERTIAIVLVVLNLYLFFVWHNHLHVSTKASDRADASSFFEIGLAVSALTILGIVVKRRALLGFACFLSGLVFVQYHLDVEFVINAAFGGWLIVRAQQAQRLARGGRPSNTAPRSRATAVSAKTPPTAQAPRPSKRYTPPKRARSTGRR